MRSLRLARTSRLSCICVRCLRRHRSVPTTTIVVQRAGSQRRSRSIKRQSTHLLNRFSNSSLLFRATFDDINSRLRSSVQRLTLGGAMWHVRDTRAHRYIELIYDFEFIYLLFIIYFSNFRGHCRDYGPTQLNQQIDVPTFFGRHSQIGCDIGIVFCFFCFLFFVFFLLIFQR